MLANARSTFSVESMALSAFASLFRIVCSAICRWLSPLRYGSAAPVPLLRFRCSGSAAPVVVKLHDFTAGRLLTVNALQMTYSEG